MKVPAIWFDSDVDPPRIAIAPPGVDASTADDDDLLLSIDLAPAQFVQAGHVYVGTTGSVVILWPFELPSPPILEIQSSYNEGETRIPYHRRSSGASGITVDVSTTGATFSAAGDGRVVSYVAVGRSTS